MFVISIYALNFDQNDFMKVGLLFALFDAFWNDAADFIHITCQVYCLSNDNSEILQ